MSYYNEISRGYNELHGEEQLKKAMIIASNIDISPDDRLLDVGCGTAVYFDIFDCQKFGIDPNIGLLKQGSGGKFIQASAEDIPFPDNSFDMVISLTAVHNFNDIKKGLEEIKRVAKDRVVISILKRSKKLDLIENIIDSLFICEKKIEDTDVFFFLRQ